MNKPWLSDEKLLAPDLPRDLLRYTSNYHFSFLFKETVSELLPELNPVQTFVV